MQKFDINQLSPAEKTIYSQAATYLNEITFIKNTAGRRKPAAKKVKGTRKKLKKEKIAFNIQEATPMHAFEALLGEVKMKTIAYLMLECKPSEVREWIYGMPLEGAKHFLKEMREPMYGEIVSIIKGDYVFRASLDVYNWLFKSGFMKRSNNIFKKYYSDGVKFSYSDEIIALKHKYRKRAHDSLKDLTFEDFGILGTVNALEGEKTFLLEIVTDSRALKLALDDIECDPETLKQAKYLATKVKTLEKIMIDFINETSEDVIKSVDSVNYAIEVNAYRKQFEPFTEHLKLSCKLEGIEFAKSREKDFTGYYETLKGYSKKQLRSELLWLRGVAS